MDAVGGFHPQPSLVNGLDRQLDWHDKVLSSADSRPVRRFTLILADFHEVRSADSTDSRRFPEDYPQIPPIRADSSPEGPGVTRSRFDTRRAAGATSAGWRRGRKRDAFIGPTSRFRSRHHPVANGFAVRLSKRVSMSAGDGRTEARFYGVGAGVRWGGEDGVAERGVDGQFPIAWSFGIIVAVVGDIDRASLIFPTGAHVRAA
jgi:hypothetical protein